MNALNSSQIIGWMIVVCALMLIFVLFSRPLRAIAKLCLNSAIGVCALLICNYFLTPLGIGVGINLYTAVFTGVLGIPGVVCLYILRMIFK